MSFGLEQEAMKDYAVVQLRNLSGEVLWTNLLFALLARWHA
jgi:hypothetical protein